MKSRSAFETRHEDKPEGFIDGQVANVAERYRAMLMQRTGEERLFMGCAVAIHVRNRVRNSFLVCVARVLGSGSDEIRR
jgi:hypothetical protein